MDNQAHPRPAALSGLEEQMHWLKVLVGVRARDRSALLAGFVPQHLHFMATCKKTQVAHVVVKLLCDSTEEHLFEWADQSLCNANDNGEQSGDFCVATDDLAAAQTRMQVLLEPFRVNVAQWWKRYVRRSPVASGDLRQAYRFILGHRPDFFSPSPDRPLDPDDQSTNAHNTDITIQTNVPVSVTNEQTSATVQIVNRTRDRAPTAAPVHTKPATRTSNVGRKKVYMCKVCGRPKRGHMCLGAPAPPLPPDEPALLAPPPLPPSIVESSRDIECEDFESIFFEEEDLGTQSNAAEDAVQSSSTYVDTTRVRQDIAEQPEPKKSRLEKLFGSGSLSASLSTRVEKEQLKTNFKL